MPESEYQPIMDGQPLKASGWSTEGAFLEGDELTVRAELTDVDEVAVVVDADYFYCEVLVHLTRDGARELAKQLLWAADAPSELLPSGVRSAQERGAR